MCLFNYLFTLLCLCSQKENDPDAISREDLSTALMPNLTAKVAFAEFCIPLALEKLDSDLKVAKLDSLVLLTNACYKFPQEKISESFKNIWSVIKNDLNSSDAEVKQNVVTLLHAMLTVLRDEDARNSFHNICDHVKYSFTSNLDKALFISNAKMITSVSKDSRACMQEIAILLVPLLYLEVNKTYNDEYIDVLNEILEICSLNLDINLSGLNDLSIAWNDLVNLYLNLCSTSMSSLRGLTILHSFLDVVQRKSMYKILYDVLKSNRPSNDFEASLCTFAKNYKNEITEHVIVPFQKEIMDQGEKGNSYPNVNNIENIVLENLKQNDPSVFTKDESEDGFMKPVAYRRNEGNEEIPIFLVICPPAPVTPVEEIFIKNVFCPLISLDSYLRDLSTDVIRFCLQEDPEESSCFRFSNQVPTTNIAYLKCLLQKYESKTDILNYLENEFDIANKIIGIYVNNATNNEFYSIPFVLDCIAILNIILNASDKAGVSVANERIHTKTLKLLEKILDTNQIGVGLVILIPLLNKIDFKHVENNDNLAARIGRLSDQLFEIAITTNDTFVNKQLSILLSIILNNIDNLESNKFAINVDSFKIKLHALPYDNNVCTLHAFLTKSLIIKGYKDVDSWLQILIENLKNHQIGTNVVESIRVIIKQDTLVEDYFEFRNVKFLYRQRLFMFTLGKILKNVSDQNESDTEKNNISVVKLNNYLAVLVQLKHLPNEILVSHVKTLLPIMIQCLTLICDTQLSEKSNTTDMENTIEKNANSNENHFDSSNQRTTCFTLINFDGALQTLLDLFKEFLITKLDILHEYINSFIERFLFVSRYHASLDHRTSALQCLYYLSYFNVIKLVPFKNKVIEELKYCLDDRKRLVRKQAVVTIDRWYILDSEVNE